ncbi:MAG: sulfite exporter TauE/SafE family protein [Ignavibacteria bacterium]|nr:sulfite exporter TauE/SafE family protein [Ignavibacteria bacterium]
MEINKTSKLDERKAMYEIAIYLIVGLAAGIMSGFLGIGGGIIIIPALTMILGFSQQQAQGTSLALLLPPIGILAVMNYYKAGSVNLKAAAFMALTFVVASYFSSKIAVQVPEQMLKKVFATFLLFYALKLFIEK